MTNSAIQSAGDLAVTQALKPSSSLMNRFAHRNGPQSVDKASKDFEGMFMSQMLQPMFETVPVDPLFGGGHGEEVMRGFLVQEYGKVLAKGSHFGIADAVGAEMNRAQQKMAAKTAQNKGGTNAAGPLQ
jgi:Rod binding domain-containing protein